MKKFKNLNAFGIIAAYILAFIIPIVAVLAAYWPIGFHVTRILPPGDYLWFQVNIESAAQFGIFGTNTHLNWPVGFNPWSHPQAGFLILIGGWISKILLGFSTYSTYVLLLGVGGGLGAVSIFFAFRVFARQPAVQLIAWVFAVSLSVTPFTITKLDHLNVSMFFIFPVFLGVLFRWTTSTKKQKIQLFVLFALFTMFSTAWWASVLLYVIVFTFPALIFRKKWSDLRALAMVCVSFLIGLMPLLLLSYKFATPGSAPTRHPWDSNLLGGHLVDFFTSAVAFSTNVPTWPALMEGKSQEGGFIGTFGGFAGLVAVFLLLALFPKTRLSNSNELLLGTLTVVTILLFFAGGLGNLQAAIFVLLGEMSPARAWSRLLIYVAILGAIWLLFYAEKFYVRSDNQFLNRIISAVICFLVVISTIADYRVVFPQPQPLKTDQLAEYKPVKFLEENLEPCPVAQFPADSTPIPVVIDWNNYGDYYYRSYIPYLISPDFIWSYGDTSADSHTPIVEIGEMVSAEELYSLKTLGYCAVLFDKQAATVAITSQIKAPGIKLQDNLMPNFETERYQVYLLK